MRYLSALFTFFSILPGLQAACQVSYRKQTVPLDTPVHITLTYTDTLALPFDNLHYFRYDRKDCVVEAGFLIDKTQDVYKAPGEATIVLSRNYGYLAKLPNGDRLWFNGCYVFNGIYIRTSDDVFLYLDFREDAEQPILRVEAK